MAALGNDRIQIERDHYETKNPDSPSYPGVPAGGAGNGAGQLRGFRRHGLCHLQPQRFRNIVIASTYQGKPVIYIEATAFNSSASA
jgi:hypothetical protein